MSSSSAPKFSDLNFRKHRGHGAGKYARKDFANGYGVSVVCTPYTYGGESGLYELAVLHRGELVYDTPVTDNVEGWLPARRVTELMREVAALPVREAA